MNLHVNQVINAAGYFTDSKYLYGTISEFETNLGYHYGRLRDGFFLAYLLNIPHVNEFDLAGYSIKPQHRFKVPSIMDIAKLKQIARDKMVGIGNSNLVKLSLKENLI